MDISKRATSSLHDWPQLLLLDVLIKLLSSNQSVCCVAVSIISSYWVDNSLCYERAKMISKKCFPSSLVV